MYFHSVSLYYIASDVKSAHTHYTVTHTLSVSFGDVFFFGLIWKGRRKGDGMDHMITLELLESSFFYINVTFYSFLFILVLGYGFVYFLM